VITNVRTFHPRRSRPSTGAKYALEHLVHKYLMPIGDWNFDELAPDHRIVIEIGSGMGEAALAYAQANPADFLVCLEVHTPGVGSMIFKADEAGIKNIKVVVRDALEVIAESIADNSVDEFRIWFPDPWRKQKHHHRRIIHPEIVDFLLTKLKSGGRFHTITDWPDYGVQMERVLAATTQLQVTKLAQRPDWRPITKFERRAQEAGRSIHEFLCVKK
jgi:tRNA (guanine-N7-)-methyltransferase